MIGQLEEILAKNQIRNKYIDRISYASDAGFYYLVPEVVVQPNSVEQIKAIFKLASSLRKPLVFRAGGTSLSGQSITDGILVDLSKFFTKISLENQALQVRVQPGATGGMVNAYLKKYSRKIGPDPSSISAAMMGGILSNNASGMCCGVKQNSYHTTKYIRLVLVNGKEYSTENGDDYARFEVENPELCKFLTETKRKIETNDELRHKISRKYQTKNTVGYGLNSFIDYDKPLDIFAHLLIGGEGTLAFIAEAVLETVPDYAFKSTGLIYFQDIFSACQAIVPLTEMGVMMAELMDRASLRSVENKEGMPSIVKTLPDNAAALLIEFQEDTQEKLNQKAKAFNEFVNGLDLISKPELTEIPAEQAFLWNVRKGLFPAVGAVRKSGTTVILEDLAFPVEKLGNSIVDLQALFQEFKYENGIIFGHAKDGNIHFVITQTFSNEKEIERYGLFMEKVVNLVVNKYQGTLKAEHGTGRNMAPFVETEWGGELYEIMQSLKKIADPNNILNPGVIINADKNAHLKNLKQMPRVEAEVDKCIECGFCEPKCPSKNFTASPRRRIVARRVLESLRINGKKAEYETLLGEFNFDGLDTCAVDGLCATACPVDINTGDLVKHLRSTQHSAFENKLANYVATNFAKTQLLIRFALNFGFAANSIFGKNTMTKITKTIKGLIPDFPIWTSEMAKPPKLNFENNLHGEIVYFPSCISRMMGTYTGKNKNLIETFYSICHQAEIKVSLLTDVNNSCCGQIFSSKGFKEAFENSSNLLVEKLWLATNNGKLPVVIDVSSCAYTLHQLKPVLTSVNQEKYAKLNFLDSVDFLHDWVLPKIKVEYLKQDIVLHSVCSLQKLKTEAKFIAIAQKFAKNITVPFNAGCCAMAGDRGFTIPELTASATNAEASEIKFCEYEGYYSSTKTCEMAMTAAVKKNYESILYLVDEGISNGIVEK